MSARRIAYAWFICLLLFLAYCVSTLRFFVLPFLKPFYAVPLSIDPKNNAALLRDPEDALIKDAGQPFYLRLLAQWLEVYQDPDVDCLVSNSDSFATGVNVGVEDPLPRSPQIFPPKVKHRRLDDTEFNPIADNYVSGQLSAKELEEKFR